MEQKTSSNTLALLEKRLVQGPIVLPQNPFWTAFKSFGLDELLAGVINVVGTAGMDHFVHRYATAWAEKTRNLAIAFAGPVIEKIGFFPQHLYEAGQERKRTPPVERKSRGYYVKNAMKEGSVSLLKDLAIHDPLYGVLMYQGLQSTPLPSTALSALSFVIAVAIASGIDVGATELLYHRFKKNLQKDGFGKERYFEARFFVRDDGRPEEMLEKIAREFALSEQKQGVYHDRYFNNKLYPYSGREAKLRLRRRTIAQEGREVKSAQIIYTRVSELAKKKRAQHRYFPVEKEKLYFLLDQEMPEWIEELKERKARVRLLNALDLNEPDVTDFTFTRTLVLSPRGLFVSTDTVQRQGQHQFYVLELKAREDTELLKEAMRYVMIEFPVLQTTYGKLDMTKMYGGK